MTKDLLLVTITDKLFRTKYVKVSKNWQVKNVGDLILWGFLTAIAKV